MWLMRGLLSRGYNLMVDLLIYKPFNPFALQAPQLGVETPISSKLVLRCHCPSGVAKMVCSEWKSSFSLGKESGSWFVWL